MNWEDWVKTNIQTLGITLAFALFGSALLLWVSADKQTISVNRASMVIVAGQIVGSVATVICFGYLGLGWVWAPGIGLVCGIAAIPIIRSIIKIAQRGEDRATDFADVGFDRVMGRRQDRMDRSAERKDDRIDKIAERMEDRKDRKDQPPKGTS